MALLSWRVVHDGKTPPPGAVVRADERLSWPRTVGLGAQHVVAMFGATFVFPIVMGLNPQLAIMMSGIATICFLLIVQNKVPSYLGTSASFVGGVVAIRAQGGDSPDVTGAILVAGVVLAACGLIIQMLGSRVVYAVLPPVVTGAVVMLIGFNLAPVVANIYWPQDQWVALLTMVAVMAMAVGFRGFLGRIAVFLGLVVGYWLGFPAQTTVGPDGKEIVGWHFPDIRLTFVLLVLPAVIALIAENTGHVKAVAEMTQTDLDPVMGRAIAADGVGTTITSLVGGSPTTTYAENIGVMAATRIYSTAAYYVAALVAIVFGFSPKFGAVISATPGGVLGGITVVL